MNQTVKQIWWERLRKMTKPVVNIVWFKAPSKRFETAPVNWFSKVPENDFEKNKTSLEMALEEEGHFAWLVKYP